MIRRFGYEVVLCGFGGSSSSGVVWFVVDCCVGGLCVGFGVCVGVEVV